MGSVFLVVSSEAACVALRHMNKFENKKLKIWYKPYLKNARWASLEWATRLVIGLFNTSLLVNYVGATNFGLISVLLAYGSIALCFTKFGLDPYIGNEIAKAEGQANDIFINALLIRLGITLPVVILIATYTFLSEQLTEFRSFYFILCIYVIFMSMDIFEQYFFATKKNKLLSVIKITVSFLFMLGKIAAVFLHADLPTIFALILLEQVILTLVLLATFQLKSKYLWKITPDLELIKNAFRESYPVFIASLSVIIYTRVDQIMLAQIVDYKILGYYATAIRFAEVPYAIPVIVVTIFFPALIEAKKNGDSDYISRLQFIYNSITLLSVLSTLLVCMLSSFVITILFGQEFETAAAILKIYSLCYLFVFIGSVYTRALTIEGRATRIMQRTLVGSCLNIFFNFILIPNYGGIGAAWATVISSFFATFVFSFLIKSERNHLRMQLKSITSPFKTIYRKIII
tara:strand:- start:4956 stop:6335 length:1380 start_codon:yes stop_codon:yes gene_type:complete